MGRTRKSWSKRTWTALCLSAILVIVAGCQAVGGLDLNAVLKQTMKVTSMEGKQQIEVQLLFREAALEQMDEDEAAMAELLSQMKLEFSDMRMQDSDNLSVKGKLSMGDKSMTFDLVSAGDRARLQLEGSKRAFYFDLAELDLSESGELEELDEETQASLMERGTKLLDYIGNYTIDNLPNPTKLSVAPAQTEVNGETLQTMRVQAEIGGDEVLPLIHSYLDALIADKEGLTELVTAIMTLFADDAEVWEAAGLATPFAEELDTEQSQEELIQEAVADVLGFLGELQTELRTTQEEEPESIEQLLGPESTFKTELYVDSKLDIRKTSTELVFKPSFPAEDEWGTDFPFEGIVIRTTGEQWNVNGDVKPEPLKTARNDLSLETLFEMPSYELVKLFEEGSLMNDLMRQMGMAVQTVELYPGYDENPPILTPEGLTLIPLRDTSDLLGARVAYLEDTGTYDVFDPATGAYLKFRKGSTRVTVNGEDQTWSFPATVIGGTLYVPARQYMTALGGTVYWDQFSFAEDEKYLVLEREF